jgi:hypothetical protein
MDHNFVDTFTGKQKQFKIINVEIMERETPCRNYKKIPNEYSQKLL